MKAISEHVVRTKGDIYVFITNNVKFVLTEIKHYE